MAKAVVASVLPGSIAEQIGIGKGDLINSINSSRINDILDYKYLSCDYRLLIEIIKATGETIIVEVESDFEDLGIIFENSLIDTPKRCKNKCIFCFIDQLPKNMRETLYFKDDDARLSFFQGNYITLTNLSDKDIDRIIKMRVSPINVSVHTTDPDLRMFMLNNKDAGKVYEIIKRLAANNITMNCQIVCCPEVNDKKHLDKSIWDLCSLYPAVKSLSVVPVGLTAYRSGLFELKPFNRDEAIKLIEQVEGWQKNFLEKYQSRVVYLADEFYLMANKPIPKEKEYEGFPQIENGVGLIASLKAEFDSAINTVNWIPHRREVSIITGELAAPFIKMLVNKLEDRFKGFNGTVYTIKNNFFGGHVSVAGLICAADIIEQTKNKPFFEELFIPSSMLRAKEDVFLDDITIEELINTLNVKITPVLNDGYLFVIKLLDVKLD